MTTDTAYDLSEDVNGNQRAEADPEKTAGMACRTADPVNAPAKT